MTIPTIKKPISMSDLIKHRVQVMQEQQRDELRIQGENEINNSRKMNETMDLFKAKENAQRNKNKFMSFSNNVKKTLLAECIHKIYSGALLVENTTDMDISSRYAYINNFIEEEGVEKLLNRFKTKTPLLCEMSNIVNKYHKLIVEKVCKEEPETHKIEDEDKDEFLKELDNEDVDKVIEIIKDRVSGAIDKFIEDNAKDKEKIKEIIAKSKEKVDSIDDEKIAESYIAKYNRDIKNVRNIRNQTIFEHMVSSISKQAILNEEVKEVLSEGDKLNMDKIIETATIMYTFLEMVNTTKMVDVNLDYINSVYEQLKS